jgi:hypothetical protein
VTHNGLPLCSPQGRWCAGFPLWRPEPVLATCCSLPTDYSPLICPFFARLWPFSAVEVVQQSVRGAEGRARLRGGWKSTSISSCYPSWLPVTNFSRLQACRSVNNVHDEAASRATLTWRGLGEATRTGRGRGRGFGRRLTDTRGTQGDSRSAGGQDVGTDSRLQLIGPPCLPTSICSFLAC